MSNQTKSSSLALRAFLKTYPWRRIEPLHEARLTKPLSECRVAVVSSAGFVSPGDEPFDHTVKGGDFSHRMIPASTLVQSLEAHHRSDSFDRTGIESDRNLGLPLDRIHELVDEGFIGSSAPHHVSLMGSIVAPGRLQQRTAPQIAERMVDDEVDIALMVPV